MRKTTLLMERFSIECRNCPSDCFGFALLCFVIQSINQSINQSIKLYLPTVSLHLQNALPESRVLNYNTYI